MLAPLQSGLTEFCLNVTPSVFIIIANNDFMKFAPDCVVNMRTRTRQWQ